MVTTFVLQRTWRVPVNSKCLVHSRMNRSSSATLFQRTSACKSPVSTEVKAPPAVETSEVDTSEVVLLKDNGRWPEVGRWNWLMSELRDPTARKAVAVEFMAQAMFNFASCSAVVTAVQLSDGSGILKTVQILAFHAALLFVLVSGTQPISGGHFNPMVSTMMAVWGELPWRRLPFYIIAQLSGAVLGSTFQYFSLPEAMRSAQFAAVQAVPPDHTVGQAFMGEVAASFVLMFVICLFGLDTDSPRADGERIPLIIAITIPFLIYIVGPVSSMCINPARAFGPAVVSGFWEHHWLWWTAPFIGGLLAILPYKALLSAQARKDV